MIALKSRHIHCDITLCDNHGIAGLILNECNTILKSNIPTGINHRLIAGIIRETAAVDRHRLTSNQISGIGIACKGRSIDCNNSIGHYQRTIASVVLKCSSSHS